jgi:hypothetical protein
MYDVHTMKVPIRKNTTQGQSRNRFFFLSKSCRLVVVVGNIGSGSILMSLKITKTGNIYSSFSSFSVSFSFVKKASIVL